MAVGRTFFSAPIKIDGVGAFWIYDTLAPTANGYSIPILISYVWAIGRMESITSFLPSL